MNQSEEKKKGVYKNLLTGVCNNIDNKSIPYNTGSICSLCKRYNKPR